MRMKRDMGENYGHNGTKKFTQFFNIAELIKRKGYMIVQ